MPATEEVIAVKVVAGMTVGKSSVMEVHLTGEQEKYLGCKYVSCQELKERGVIKRSNSFEKAEKWLNAPEGLKWVAEAKSYRLW